MARRERRQLSDEYKAEVVALVRSSGTSVGAISRDLDLTETAVRDWVQRADVDGGQRNGLTTAERDELSRLRRQVRVLEEERNSLKNPPRLLRQEDPVSRYRFIEVENVNHAARTLCRVLKVSCAASYRWSIHPLSAHAQADFVLSERIARIHKRSRQTYGAPRVHAELHACGELHDRKRVARLMRRAGIAGRFPERYRRTTIGDPFTVLPDLVQRDFTPTCPDQVWVGDITYGRTWEGWLYLSLAAPGVDGR